MLERLRAALHLDPLLVVPTAADVSHYGQELAAGGVVFGAQVLTFENLVREIGRVAGVKARPLGRVARDRVVRAAIADAHLRRLAPSGAAPGFAARGGRPVRRAAALAGRARALHARPARLGRRALRRRARGPVFRLPAAAGDARAPRPRGRGVGRARRAARRPGALGPAARLPLRLRRADPRAARRGRHARAARRRRGLRRAALRARPRTRWRAAPRRCRSSLRAPRSSSCPSAPTTTPGSPGPPSTTSSAACSRRRASSARPTARCGCWRRAASAPRRRSSAPRCSS